MENKEEDEISIDSLVDEDKVLVENYKSTWKIIGVVGSVCMCLIMVICFIIILL